MSSFDVKPPSEKYPVTAILNVDQRIEFNAMKSRLGLKTDTALIKRALSELAHAIEENRAKVDISVPEDDDDDTDEPEEAAETPSPESIVDTDAWTPTTS